MKQGVPVELPIGIVDQDNTTTSRNLIRKLDAFQTSKIVGHYANMNDARNAMQRNEIYAFLLIPQGTTNKLLSNKRPKISFYYSNVSLTAGALLFKDLKTICTLASAGVGKAKLEAIGKSSGEIRTFLQPIVIDLHMINNPWTNYNLYLSTMIVPGILMLFMFLITAYSLGTELKFKRSKEWMSLANNNIYIAIIGKLLPQFLIFISIIYSYMFYVFGILDFPHPGGLPCILILGLLTVLAAQGFGVFAFGLMPSLRMSMSVCSLWAVLSFSISGATYPVFSMAPEIEALAQLFPLRHYYMIYQICIFNGFPLTDAWFNIMALGIFACLPLFTFKNIKRAMLLYIYIP